MTPALANLVVTFAAACPVCATGEKRSAASVLLFGAIALVPLLIGAVLAVFLYRREREER